MRIPKPAGRAAFSMVELLLAIAIFALLMLGIDYVFRATTKTIAAGQALSAAVRDSRSAHTVIYNDLKACISEEMPFFIIHSERRGAFLRAQDRATDGDNDPSTIDLDRDGAFNSQGENLAQLPAARNYRNCRADILGFFVRDLHRKQTGSAGQLISPMGTTDAYVCYGHVLQPGPSGAYFAPGQGDDVSNPANYFSADWVLGRSVLLLSPFTVDRAGVNQVAIDTLQFGGNPLLLAAGASASREPLAQYRMVPASRHDLVATTVQEMADAVATLQRNSPNSAWWADMVYRFRADSSPRMPLDSAGAALNAPLLLPHCRQFLVEYAGDFVTQLTDVRGIAGPDSPPDGKLTSHDINDLRYGQVIAYEPDGLMDFYTVPTGAMVNYSNEPPVPERIERIRFYGYPRDAEGIGRINGAGNATMTNDLPNVVPLRDVVLSGRAANAALASFAGAPFERILPPVAANYLASGALPANAAYTCVWGPSDPRPQLLRVIVTLEDPKDRMGMGQTHEYVLQVNR